MNTPRDITRVIHLLETFYFNLIRKSLYPFACRMTISERLVFCPNCVLDQVDSFVLSSEKKLFWLC